MGNPRKSSNSGEDLHTAARTGDIQTVQSICASNPLAVNSRDKHSRTPLHLAAWSGKTEVVRYLCQHKADVGAAAMDDMGSIHFASQKGHLEIVRILLSSGVSVKAASRKGFTPLHYAVQGSHLDLIKYLVRKGASLSVKSKAGKSPLDLANSEEVRSILVDCEESLKKREKPIERADAVDSSPLECEESSKKREKPIERADAVDSSPKQSDKTSNIDSAGGGTAQHVRGEEEDETRKRKGEEAGRLPVTKKSRVALNHLLAGNDMEEEGGE